MGCAGQQKRWPHFGGRGECEKSRSQTLPTLELCCCVEERQRYGLGGLGWMAGMNNGGSRQEERAQAGV